MAPVHKRYLFRRLPFLILATLMIDMFRRHGIRHQWTESEGGHTWINWREYLTQMAPLLFR